MERYKTVILPVVVYEFDISSHFRLRVFENRVLRILDLKGEETDHGEHCIMINFMACILHRILLG
jgi:hypothetical protein